LCGCKQPPPARWSEAWVAAEREQYLSDPAFRRKALIASLENPSNTYSSQRLGSYGLQTRGWDLLPVWNPRSVRLPADLSKSDGDVAPLWDGVKPKTSQEWVALGKEVFFAYPLRAEGLVEFAVEHPELAEEVGLERTAEGAYVGLVRFPDIDGRTRIGITCALCHAVVRDGKPVAGPARRGFDYGKLRLTYHRETKEPVEADLARRMATWGPGRADVTEDVDEDPVAIPDLWALRQQEALTQAGGIRHTGPTALAIRQETQLLHSNHERVRPPRELAWALAMYLYSLEPAPDPKPATAQVTRGAKLFERGCSECHSNPAYGGPPVAEEKVGTDAALANGAARGTGRYRPPALVRVRDAAPYLHQGALSTLEELMGPERLAPEFRGSPLGPGPVKGHAFGTDWPPEDRAAVIAWMRTL
jgi:cytochrome c5